MTLCWRLELFGGLRAMRENEIVDRFRTQKTATLLAYFALKPGPQPREVLIDLLWPEAEPEAARNSLSASLSSLRRQLEPESSPGGVLLSTRASAGLHPESFVSDVAEFDAALKAAERASTDTDRCAALARAVRIYSGPLLPGFYDDWLSSEARRREEEFSEALSDLLDLLDEEQNWEGMIGYARHGLSLLPTREECHLALMRAQQMLGKPEAALRQFDELRTALSREGGEPSSKARRMVLEAQGSRDAKQLVLSDESEAPIVAEKPAAVVVSPVEAAPLLVPIQEAPPPSTTTTFLMLERPKGEREHDFVMRELLKYNGRLERQVQERTLWTYDRYMEASQAATAVQVGLATLPPLDRPRMAFITEEAPSGRIQADEAATEHVRVLMQGAHPGQILCDERSAELLRAAKVSLLNLGRYCVVGNEPERLFQVEYPAAPTFAPPSLTAASASHLPPQFTRFFGREAEIQQLHRLVADDSSRLVTLLGPGGSGKTRLAIEAARTLGDDRFAIYFVPLADIEGEAFIFPAMRDAMKLPSLTGVSPRDQLFEVLAARPTILILDNFEQLVETGSDCVQELLRAAPLLHVLITSRQMLNIQGEREFPVPPLPVPEHDISALLLKEISSAALFIDRAQASRVDFRVDERNAPYIAAICQRLDGIPLALELAAARSLVLSPAQMLEKLRDRLDILSTRQRGVPERHRTLRTAIEWSYGLLAPELQQFFASLSVFRGGWTLEAAEVVCEEFDALDFLTRLRECSLVVTQERGDETRFRMLEMLREYASTQLKPDQLAHREQLYAAHFARVAESAEPHLRGPQQAAWLELLEAEQDNFRAVLSWAMENDAGVALRLAAALSPFWETRGHYAEGRDWLERALALHDLAKRRSQESARTQSSSQEQSLTRARALNGAGWMAYYATDFATAGEQLEESLNIFRASGDMLGAVKSLAGLASRAALRSDFKAMRSYANEVLTLFRVMDSLEDRASVVLMLAKIGLVTLQGADPADVALSRTLGQESVAIARVVNDKLALAIGLIDLGAVANFEGNYTAARIFLDEGIPLAYELNEPFYSGYGLWNQGKVAFGLGQFEQARAFYFKSQELSGQHHVILGFPYLLEGLAELALAEGNALNAATLLGAAHARRQENNAPVPPYVAPAVDATHRAARAKLGETAFVRAWERGLSLSAEEAFSHVFDATEQTKPTATSDRTWEAAPFGVWPEPEAAFEPNSPVVVRGRALCSAGRLAWFESEFDGARALLEKGLALLRGAGDDVGVVNAISSLSMVLSWQGENRATIALLRESLEIVRPLQNRLDFLPTLANFGWALSFSSLPETVEAAREINEKVVELARAANDKRSLAWALDSLTQNSYWRRDWRAARRYCDEAIALFEQLDDRFGGSHAIWIKGDMARYEGKFEEALRLNDESLELSMKLKNRVGLPYILESYAYLALAKGYFRTAAFLLGATEASREIINPRQDLVQIEHERLLKELHSRLDDATFEEEWEKGRTLGLEEAVLYARELAHKTGDDADTPRL
ncbi:hypothetical protein EON83_12845 [bacterium]|nr:MAG: hypothetical protein EON83_12845 [bacterium]